MAKWECPDCHTMNANPSTSCEICGTARIGGGKTIRSPLCGFDGGWLREDLFCEVGIGYPVGVLCPFACPVCRHPLGWAGGCEYCHGTLTGRRDEWSVPGDRYELQRGHWVVDAKGPRKALTEEEVKALMAELKRIVSPLTGLSSAATAGDPGHCTTCGAKLEPVHTGATCTPCWFTARATARTERRR